MKIQFNGQKSFTLKNSKVEIITDPIANSGKEVDFVTLSEPKGSTEQDTKKVLNLPGEFEISNILAQGFFTDNRENIVYKIIFDEIAIINFGNLGEVPTSKFYEVLGENVDVLIISLSENFNHKDAKALVDKVDPRMVLFGGDVAQYPKIIENLGAKTLETSNIKITRNGFADDKTEIYVMNI